VVRAHNARLGFDPKTEADRIPMPFKWQLPYDAELDKAGWVERVDGHDRRPHQLKTGENTVISPTTATSAACREGHEHALDRK
jgi:hypothetical protein